MFSSSTRRSDKTLARICFRIFLKHKLVEGGGFYKKTFSFDILIIQFSLSLHFSPRVFPFFLILNELIWMFYFRSAADAAVCYCNGWENVKNYFSRNETIFTLPNESLKVFDLVALCLEAMFILLAFIVRFWLFSLLFFFFFSGALVIRKQKGKKKKN